MSGIGGFILAIIIFVLVFEYEFKITQNCPELLNCSITIKFEKQPINLE